MLSQLWDQRIGAITYHKAVKDLWPESVFSQTGHQTAIISTAQHLRSPVIAGRMFSRWRQENMLTICIHRMAIPAHDTAIASLLADLTQINFRHPETGMRLIYTLA